jgi:hypothetical protein
VIEVAYHVWSGLAIGWVLLWAAYSFTVPGTEMRYRLRSVMRPIGWAAPAYFAVTIIVRLAEGNFFLAVFDVYNTYWTFQECRKFYSSDEDDWWKGRKKKIAAWGKRKLESIPRPQFVNPVPQGA